MQIRSRPKKWTGPRIGPVILFSMMMLLTIHSAMDPTTVQADDPELSPVGTVYYETEGVHPITGQVQQMFVFRIVYADADNDPPKGGHPRLLIDIDGDRSFDGAKDRNLSMEAPSSGVPQFSNGVDFHRNFAFDGPGTYNYAFFVENEAGETAFIGPFKGPIVYEKELEPHQQDWWVEVALWLILLLIFSICFLVVGIGVGQARGRDRKKTEKDKEGSKESGTRGKTPKKKGKGPP